MSTKKLKKFFKQGVTLKFKKGQVILQSGKSPDGVYYIDKGFVRAYSGNPTKEVKFFAIYKSKEIFPLIWTLINIDKRLYYEALDNVTLFKRSKRDFLDFIRNDHKGALEVIDSLTLLFNMLMDRVDNLETIKAYPRLIGRLLFFSKRFGVKQSNKVNIRLPINQSQIAHSIAMTRETASREIKKLEQKGLIAYRNNFIVINDEEKFIEELSKS